jgi:SAM-dependent methyltransferase
MTGRASIWYGAHVADDSELRLCGDLTGKRAIELGVGPTSNAVAIAAAGARAIAVDPAAEAIARVRAAAETAEVTVQCHHGELADLGFATSASIDLVVAAHTLDEVDDLPRLLRQVHRVLRPGAGFVIAVRHPVAQMFEANDPIPRRHYGAEGLTFADLYMSLERSDFHCDAIHELDDRRLRDPISPAVLVLRARKLGV